MANWGKGEGDEQERIEGGRGNRLEMKVIEGREGGKVAGSSYHFPFPELISGGHDGLFFRGYC